MTPTEPLKSAILSPVRPANHTDLDAAIGQVYDASMRFAQTSYAQRAMLLRNLIPRAVALAERWVRLSCHAKGISHKSPTAGEEWLAGPVVTVRNMRLLAESLEVLAEGKRMPHDRLPSRERVDGKCEVDVFPTSRLDATLFKGFTGTVVLRSKSPQHGYYRSAREVLRMGPPICVVLGAGNVSSIPAMDVLSKVFMEGKPCVLKMNPVNEYLAPVFAEMFEPLIALGILRIVCGGADVGAYLCQHPLAGEVHITGSDATHDTVVWGPPGPERDRRKAASDPVLKVPITSELGNVSPVVIIPGKYSFEEMVAMAKNVVSMVTNNASFNCNAAKVLVTSRQWEQREGFLRLVRGLLRAVPPRKAYYPGAKDRFVQLITPRSSDDVWFSHDLTIASPALPWTLVQGLDSDAHDEPLFRTEPFCSILSEAVIDERDEFEFMLSAIDFCNARLRGTLNVCIMVASEMQKDGMFAMAFDGMIDDLHYGTVSVNHPPWLSYGFGSTPWGGYPDGCLRDPKSGIGWVHNTYMLGNVEKVVIRGPLVMKPKPAWQYDNRSARIIGRKLVEFEAEPSWGKLPAIVLAALRG